MCKAPFQGSHFKEGHRRKDRRKGWPCGISLCRLHHSRKNHQLGRYFSEWRRQEAGLKLMVGRALGLAIMAALYKEDTRAAI